MFDDRNVSSENQIKLWQHYNDTLAKGVDVGYSPTPEMYDPKLAHSLKYDVAKFSAFKETSFRKQLESALTKDGKIVPWSEFKKTADALHIDYNRRWLKTEYNHTVATANMAEQWQEFEADKDLYPNLKYVTAGDARVRDAHKILDGLILPINHPFWKSHTAPLDWGCRCHIEQSDDEPSKIIPTYKVKEEFQNNAFHSGKVFNGSAYENGLSEVEKAVIENTAARNLAETNYKTFEIPFKGKGKILSSDLVDVNASDYNDVLKCCSHFAKKGSITEILPTVNVKSPLYKELYADLMGTLFEGKCPDFKVGNLFYELEGFEGLPNADKLGKMLSRGLKQSSRVVLKDDGSTLNHIKKLINFAEKRGKLIDEVWIFRNNGALEQVH